MSTPTTPPPTTPPPPTPPTTPPPTVKAVNGAVCVNHADCASGNCGVNGKNEKHCYGNVQGDQTCSTTYDCRQGACVPESATGRPLVCAPSIADCFKAGVETCFIDLAVAVCGLAQDCGADESFDACVGSMCGTVEQDVTLAECPSLVTKAKSGTVDCPSP